MSHFRVCAIFAALVLTATACGPIPTSPPSPADAQTTSPASVTRLATSASPPPKVLRIGISTYPDVLDPQKAASEIETAALRLVYEGLVSVDEKGNVQPAGAERWESSKDGLQTTFHIRDGLERMDGTPITAKDYEYALKRAVDPRISDKQNTFLLYDIRGAEELDKTDPVRIRSEEIDRALANYGVKAADDKTLVITFKRPIGYWQYVASTLVAFPSEKKQVDRNPDNWWSRPEGHNGNGMFAIRSIDQGRRIVFTPNPNYWRGKPKLDRIELVYYADSRALLEAYRKGEIDLDTNITAEDLAAISADPTLDAQLLRFPKAVTYALAFNGSRKPFDDRNVRLAFSQAVDREGWVRDVLQGVGKPYTRWIPPGVPGAQPEKPGVPTYDAKAAVMTLVSNGYAAKDSTPDLPKVDCLKLGEVRLTFLKSPLNQTRSQFLASNFSRVLGCPIMLDALDPGPFSALARDTKNKPSLSFQGYLQDYAHPQDWLSLYWVCGNEFAARYGYCNRQFDALVAKADQEVDFPKSLQSYQQAEDLLMKDVPAAFLSYAENLYLVKPWVNGPIGHTGSSDGVWAGEWGPVWEYDIDLAQVPSNYPK